MAVSRELSDGGVLLRPPAESDVDEIYGAVRESLEELLPWMAWSHPDYQRIETAEWVRATNQAWANDTEYSFAILDRAGGAFLGTCGLNAIDRLNRWANLGYWVRSTATRRGVATRAARLIADFGLRELALDRIEILAATGNEPSQRVAAKVGTTREGVLRRRLRVGEASYDAVVFSLIRDDPQAPAARA
jgi:RimJ/RimL family protein N-acetyltransferase